jgi:hypothetical protein
MEIKYRPNKRCSGLGSSLALPPSPLNLGFDGYRKAAG